MRSELLAVALVLLLLGILHGPAPSSGISTVYTQISRDISGDSVRAASTPNSIQETTFASRSLYAQTTFWQNGTHVYSTGSIPVTVASNISGIPRTTVYSQTLMITPSMHNGMVPMLNVSQGASVTLANATVPYSFTVSPLAASTPTTIRVPAAFTSTGSTPSVAAYPVYLNLSQQASYFVSSTPSWTLTNGSRENLSYAMQVPTGYVLNQTSVFVPFPTYALPNVTTFNITTLLGARQTNLTTYQLVSGGVWAYLPSLARNESLQVAYYVAGVTTGSTPSIPLGVIYPVSIGWYQANASWVNTRTLPWGGQFFITFNSTKYEVVPGSLTLTANLKHIVNSTYSLAGGAIIVLPGTVTVNPGRAIFFQATFELMNLVPGIRLCTSCSVGNSALTWGELASAFEGILLVVAGVWAYDLRKQFAARGARWGPFTARTRGWWAIVFVFFAVLIVYLIALLVGG